MMNCMIRRAMIIRSAPTGIQDGVFCMGQAPQLPTTSVMNPNFRCLSSSVTPNNHKGHKSHCITFQPNKILVQNQAFNSTESSSTDNQNEERKTPEETGDEVPEKEKQLLDENAQLKAKHDEIMDKYRRSIAESDNMRKRLTKQIEDAKIFGIQGFCKDLLDVADVLNKAITNVDAETLEKESQYLRDMFEGLKLTETQLLQVFKRHGLEKENPLNEKFDPNKHEALFQIPAPDKDPNVVLDVQKVGYILHGRTIRPALVGVSKK